MVLRSLRIVRRAALGSIVFDCGGLAEIDEVGGGDEVIPLLRKVLQNKRDGDGRTVWSYVKENDVARFDFSRHAFHDLVGRRWRIGPVLRIETRLQVDVVSVLQQDNIAPETPCVSRGSKERLELDAGEVQEEGFAVPNLCFRLPGALAQLVMEGIG